MLAQDFPSDTTVSKQGNVCVKYLADTASSRYLTGSKAERKLRYVEVAKVRSTGRYFLLVYKVKKNNTVPFFKIEIVSSSVVRIADRYSEFRFFIDNEDLAIFDLEDSETRNDWVEHLNGVITSLKSRSPTPQKTRSVNAPLTRSPSTERSRTPIYARSTSREVTDSMTTPISSSQLGGQQLPASRNRGLFTGTSTSVVDTSNVGLVAEPVRRIQRHIESSPLVVTGSNQQKDNDLDKTIPIPELATATKIDNTVGESFSLSPYASGALGARATSPEVSRPFDRHGPPHFTPSPVQKVKKVANTPGTGIGAGPGTGHAGIAEEVIGGDMTSPPRAPGMRATSSVASPSLANFVKVASTGALPVETDTTSEVPSTPPAGPLPMREAAESPEQLGNLTVGVLLQENQALSAMNEELNEALERTESLLRATEDDHGYQLAHLRALLDKAQEEPAQLKAELADLYEEKESSTQAFADMTHEMELQRTDIRNLQEELAASTHIIHGLEDKLVNYETKYSERNVERISQLEGALNASRVLLSEREIEVEELTNQLEAYRRMIREKEMELREEPFIARSAEKAAKREEMQKEIEVLRDQLDRKDQDFIAGIGGAMESQIRAKMVPLNLSAKKLTSDLAASHAAEEAQRLSRVRLENVVAQQEAYIEQLNQQVATLRAETVKIAELQQELAMHKDDARAASLQRDQAFKDREDSARRVSTLEREAYNAREAFQKQLEAAQAEIFKQRAQVTKVGMEDSHLQTELGILQRRVELGREQYLQLETQLHEAQRQFALEGQHNSKKKDSFQESLEAANATVRELQSQCKSLEDLLAAEQLDGRRRMQEHEETVTALKRTNKESVARIGMLEEKSHKLELGLTSERITSAHLKEVNEALETKLQNSADKHAETVDELESSLSRVQKSLSEVRQQLKDSESQRRTLSERDGSSQREMNFALKAAEDTNRALREEIGQLNRERHNEHKAMEDRFTAQLTLQEKLERKTQELERFLSSSESERRIADQHHATREAELITINTELTTEKDGLEVYLQKDKSEVTRLQRALEEVQTELRGKTQFHEKLTKLYNEQVQVSTGLSEEIAQLRKASAEQINKHNLEVDQLQHKYNSLQASLSQSGQAQQARIQTLEDSLISTSQELKRTGQQLEESQAKIAEVEEARAVLAAALKERNAELQTVAAQLESHARESATQSQRIAELTHATSTQRDSIAELTTSLREVEATASAHAQELESVRAQLQDTEDQLRDCDRNLKAAEDQVHYLQNIAIPDINNSAFDSVERSKSEQARYTAEIEALHRSIEQREKAAQHLHARIRELEEVEVTLNQNYATLSLKLGEMIPIKEHNHRLEQQRTSTSTEIAELSATKLAALSERDEAVNKMTVVMQECRREAYTLRRIASNIAIHSDNSDVRPKDHSRSGLNLLGNAPVVTSSRPIADIFNAAEETGSELREMVALVNAYSEGMLRDFSALRTSATHQHLALQTEVAKSTTAGAGTAGESAGPAAASFIRSPMSQQSPTCSPTRESSAQPAVTLAEMLQQNESMLAKLVNREKMSVSRLARQLEDALALKAQGEVKVTDLQTRIESLDAQLVSLQGSKQSTDQRCSAEVNALQQRVNTLLADLDKRQDEYSEMIAGLTKSHEDQVARQATHLAAVMDQRVAEIMMKSKGRVEELEQRLRGTETTLTAELEGLKRDYDHQVQQYQHLQRECEQRGADSNSAYARLETLQNELEDKTSQLENCLSQLEKAELKAAKEARQRLELERVVRRFKNPSGAAAGAGASMYMSTGERSEEAKDTSFELPTASALRARTAFNASSSRLSVGPSPTAPVVNRSFYSRDTPDARYARDARQQDNSFDGNAFDGNASITSYSVADEYADTPEVRYGAPTSPAAAPITRTAVRAAPVDPVNQQSAQKSQYQRDPRLTALLGAGTQSSSSSTYSIAEKVVDTNRIMSKASFAYKPTETRESAAATAEPRKRYIPATSVTSTIRSAYSTPDRSPEHAPLPVSSGASFRADPSASASSTSGNSAFNRALNATSRIEEAMKAKGWKLNK